LCPASEMCFCCAIEFDVEMVKDYSLGSGEPHTTVEVCELVDDDDEALP